jgi:hypothetical protein
MFPIKIPVRAEADDATLFRTGFQRSESFFYDNEIIFSVSRDETTILPAILRGSVFTLSGCQDMMDQDTQSVTHSIIRTQNLRSQSSQPKTDRKCVPAPYGLWAPAGSLT